MFETMFENVGGKIKILATVLCWLGIAGAIIYGIVLMTHEMVLFGILTVLLGSFSSWIVSLFLYAFGELAENSTTVAYLLRKMDREREFEKQRKEKEDDSEPHSVLTQRNMAVRNLQSNSTPWVNKSNWICKKCRRVNDNSLQYCKNCGESR